RLTHQAVTPGRRLSLLTVGCAKCQPGSGSANRPAPGCRAAPDMRGRVMFRLLLMTALLATLAGCGLGETAVTAAAGGLSQAEEAKRMAEQEAKVLQRIDAAQQVEQQQRRAADEESAN